VRFYDTATTTDAMVNTSPLTTKKINSYVTLGPFGDPGLSSDVRIDELDLSIADGSGNVTWSLYRGNSAEEAEANVAAGLEAASGLVVAGRNYRTYPRVRGPALYVRLASTAKWAYEAGTMILAKLGRVRV
jgi:hypothetical protein